MPLYSFRGCSNNPIDSAPLSHIRFLPTRPLEFARPSGKRADFDMSSSRGVSTPLAQTTTFRARCLTSRLRASKYTAPLARPWLSISILRTYELGRISQRPVFSATGITVARVLDLARTSHPNISQKPHCTQAPRPRYGCERIATGAGNGCRPSFRAARSNNTPDDLTGIGGSGYGPERGASKGLAPACPEIPNSTSAFFFFKQKTAYEIGQSSKLVPGISP